MSTAPRLILIACVLCSSCGKETPSQRADRQYYQMEASYLTGDVRTVEGSLSNYLQTLAAEESNNVSGIDYDMSRAIVHERLFLIYRKTQETNKMEFHFAKSIEFLTRFDERKGLPAPKFTHDTLAEALERSERHQNVRWKKE